MMKRVYFENEYGEESYSIFSIIVTIQTKNGKVYTLKRPEYKLTPVKRTIEEKFVSGLRNVTIDSVLERLSPDIGLEGMQYEGRDQRAIKIQVGDRLELVREPDNAKSLPVIDVKSREGSVGLLPHLIAMDLMPLLDSGKITCKATVTEIRPSTQRSGKSDASTVCIHIDVKKTNNKDNIRLRSVEELWSFITDATQEIGKSRVNPFIKSISTSVKSLADIKTIVFDRDYIECGDDADRISDSDDELHTLAENFLHSNRGIERDEAKRRFVEYMNKPNVNLEGHEFGGEFRDFRYAWNKNDDITVFAQRLKRRWTGEVQGVEHSELNLDTGVFLEYASFDLG